MIPIIKSDGDLSRVLKRSQLNNDNLSEIVKNIVNDVRDRGDAALFEYTEKFDRIKLNADTVLVTQSEIDAAVASVPKVTLDALKRAKANILQYHKRQLRKDKIVEKDGKKTGWIMRPVERAGIYVPGGKAAYPSSVLMCAIPAVVAGVKDITMVTPAGSNLNPATIAAAHICGVQRILRVGGAQAIAALAYGTASVPKVDVITGPGNIYVTLAKKEVFGSVNIDMIAGPSEVLIIADKSANAQFVAADLLSQAEHDELAMSVLITDDSELAQAVQSEVSRQLKLLPRKEIAQKSLENYGAIILTNSIDEAIEIANKIAPEHLELCIKNCDKYLDKVTNAGAVFLGNFSPEPLGDYYAGANHVLPTSGTARHFSALSVDNYIKKISVISYGKNELFDAADDIITLAETEGLTAHANTIRARTGTLK